MELLGPEPRIFTVRSTAFPPAELTAEPGADVTHVPGALLRLGRCLCEREHNDEFSGAGTAGNVIEEALNAITAGRVSRWVRPALHVFRLDFCGTLVCPC